MIKRTLMQNNQELVDFEVDPATSKARVIDASEAGDDLLASVMSAKQTSKPTTLSRDKALSKLVSKRAISPLRKDRDDVLAAFGVESAVELVLRGHGLSLSDQFWYRAPASTERWEDINFFDNEWDPSFGAAVFKRDYASLASCSPNTPDTTTCGRAVKTWERGDDGIFLIKESKLPDGSDLAGAKLAADLCALLFDEGYYVPLDIVERNGRHCAASPLMITADEEFAGGERLSAIAGMREEPNMENGLMSLELLQFLIEAYTAVGIADASAHIARIACCSCLAFTRDFHSGNYGMIRAVDTNIWRPAPLFDFEGSFGFISDESIIRALLANPDLAMLSCASHYSFLDPSWDWSWYDPQALEGFEERIEEALDPCKNMPPQYARLTAQMFAMQRTYVNDVASARA